MDVSCECCVLSSRVRCDGLITHPWSPAECGVSECDREASKMKSPLSTTAVEGGKKKKKKKTFGFFCRGGFLSAE